MNIDDAKKLTPFEVELLRQLTRIANSLEKVVDLDAK